ncbi:MAG: transcription termination factor NusA [Pseudomonadota bacterium]
MNKEILLVVEAVSNERDVAKEHIFEAIEAALASATRKKQGADITVRVQIDRKTGDYDTFRRWQVVDDSESSVLEHPLIEVSWSVARESEPDIAVGDFLEEQIPSVEFGRIAAQTAKQVIGQKVREAERAKVIAAFEDQVGQMVAGTVKRHERGCLVLDMGGNAEAIIPKGEAIPHESARIGDRIRAYLYALNHEGRGPQLVASRTHPNLLSELFRLEVPELNEGLIEVLGAARDPGLRAKLLVRSRDPRIEPVGTCVGMRGLRVQAVTNELCGERVDVIVWDDNPAQLVINAMSPAEVVSIVIDEDKHSMDVAVENASLSQAIGRGGQNVRLASRLTGWTLNVMSQQEAGDRQDEEAQQLLQLFMTQLDVDEEIADILVREGFATIEDVAYVEQDDILGIDEFNEDIVAELRQRAEDILLTRAIAGEETTDTVQPPANDLLTMDGMNPVLAEHLAAHGISTMEDLAECAVDDLLVIDSLDAEQAGALIMAARAPWFAEQTGEAA